MSSRDGFSDLNSRIGHKFDAIEKKTSLRISVFESDSNSKTDIPLSECNCVTPDTPETDLSTCSISISFDPMVMESLD